MLQLGSIRRPTKIIGHAEELMTILGDEMWPVLPREAHKRAFNFHISIYLREGCVCIFFGEGFTCD